MSQQLLAKILREKSQTLNLFSKGDREKLEEKHIPDALAALEFWKVEPGDKVIDIGTGGGLPGLALAIERPDVSFVLLDSRLKKIMAVSDVAKELSLTNVKCISGRIEELARQEEYRMSFNLVTARALAPLPTLLEYAAGFLKPGGKLCAWKGREYHEELVTSENAQELLGLKFKNAWDYSLPGGELRSLLVFEKDGELDDKYPRRTGLPKSRAL